MKHACYAAHFVLLETEVQFFDKNEKSKSRIDISFGICGYGL